MSEDIDIYFRIPMNNDAKSLHGEEHGEGCPCLMNEFSNYMHVRVYGGNLIGRENNSSDNNKTFPAFHVINSTNCKE